MTYKIKVSNKFGTYYSREFNDKKQAMKILNENKIADKLINKMGYQNLQGKSIKMNNKYKLLKR